MPLKHSTETILILALAAVTIVTGVALDTLPLLPEGALPWVIAFGVNMLYALLFYPMLKKNRVEYAFRLLHFLPAGLLVLWLAIQLSLLREPRMLVLHHWYTWGFAVSAVGIGFLLLAGFCLSVLRRRVSRITVLALLFAPFAAFAVLNERTYHWDKTLSATVFDGAWWDIAGTGTFLDVKPAKEVAYNSEVSVHPQEEVWRRRLRRLDLRRKEIALERIARSSLAASSVVSSTAISSAFSDRSSSARISLKTSSSASSGKTSSSSRQSSTGREYANVRTPPSKLPKSGTGIEFLVLSMLAGYTGVVHDRARKRMYNGS